MVALPLVNDEENKYEEHVFETDSINEFESIKELMEEDVQTDNQSVRRVVSGNGKSILIFKVCLLLALLAGTITVSVAVFRYTDGSEMDDFELQYYVLASKMTNKFKHSLDMKLSTAHIISRMYTSRFEPDDWPFVFMPDFEDQYSNMAALTHGSRYVGFNPMVEQRNRFQWEEFVVGNSFTYTNAQTIWSVNKEQQRVNDTGAGPFFPVCQIYPPENGEYAVMHNQRSVLEFETKINFLVEYRTATLSDFNFVDYYMRDVATQESLPCSSLFVPIFKDFGEIGNNSEVVGYIYIDFLWEETFRNILPDHLRGIHCVLETSQGNQITFLVTEKAVKFVGLGDHHQRSYDHMRVYGYYSVSEGFNDLVYSEESKASHKSDNDTIKLFIYPTSSFESVYATNEPVLYTTLVAAIFVFITCLYVAYDCIVERRQRQTTKNALKAGRVVKNLFPEHVRDRMFRSKSAMEVKSQDDIVPNSITMGEDERRRSVNSRMETPSYKLNSFLRQDVIDPTEESSLGEEEPIADLFPNVTVMFGDISGFTAWSSQREPTEVFKLLEAVYKQFDRLARRRNVFKVETIGDSYVAVAGLPIPNENHALVMTRFANECRYLVSNVTRELETELGPGTSQLAMRFGLHSGPVIAGVLRGDKARFQLFGDSVNTAARMESTGKKDRIQVSQETANLLKSSGKEHWLIPREDRVVPKGKGEMQTYWIVTDRRRRRPSLYSSEHGNISERTLDTSNCNKLPRHSFGSDNSDSGRSALVMSVWKASEKWYGEDSTEFFNTSNVLTRLIDWNTAVLEKFLVNVVASHHNSASNGAATKFWERQPSKSYLDEVVDAVTFTGFQSQLEHPEMKRLGESVRSQLREYVGRIAAFYRQVPFHNFEHASHVTMSASKLIRRITTPTDVDFSDAKEAEEELMRNEEAKLHEATFGISSDPLAQFAVIFSALIHDVDHRGVPNATLVSEENEIAQRFNGKSVLEQNSLDAAWRLLTQPYFAELRNAICATESEVMRFRQLLVNSVIATDIADKERSRVGKERWLKSFNDKETEKKLTPYERNRKATVVLEQIIQASDVAHTMQHWHAYLKWNEKLYLELYAAFRQGRSDSDPSDPEKWYKGEIGFFDFYVIPLARKLKQSGVFRAAGDEYLNYALANRQEWIEKGKTVVFSWKAKLDEL